MWSNNSVKNFNFSRGNRWKCTIGNEMNCQDLLKSLQTFNFWFFNYSDVNKAKRIQFKLKLKPMFLTENGRSNFHVEENGGFPNNIRANNENIIKFS